MIILPLFYKNTCHNFCSIVLNEDISILRYFIYAIAKLSVIVVGWENAEDLVGSEKS